MNHLDRTPLWSFVAALSFALTSSAQMNVLTYHNNNARTGENLNEAILNPGNVKSSTFSKLFAYPVDGYVFAQPLVVHDLAIPGQGLRNVLFVATAHNTVYAFDADNNVGSGGGLLWSTNLGSSATTPTTDFGWRYGGTYTDITPEVGITGTPVIDLVSGTLYLDAFTHEGASYYHRLHALNITNGTERVSPVLVSASVTGVGTSSIGGRQFLTATQHLQRAAMTLAGGILYATYTGFADTNPYHGWILGYNPATLQLLTNYIFITTPNSTVAAFGANAGEGGLWMGGNGLAVDANTNLYFEVGNGIFTATNNSGGTEYSDSFMRLSTTNGLAVADYFTPFNQASLAAGDTDLGSGGCMLLPDQSGGFPHLLVGAGKEGKIYLVNREQMTTGNNHYNSTGSADFVVQSFPGKIAGSFSTPAWFNGRIYWAASGDTLKAFVVTNGPANVVMSTNAVSTGPRTFAFPGATASVSANGTNNGIIWAVQMGTPAVLAAYNATNLTTELYNSSQAGTRDQLANSVKFVLPTVANGKVYVGGQYSVAVFGLAPIENWRAFHFGSNATNALIAGDFADPDGDGMVNLLEYAIGSDPNTAGKEGLLTGTIRTNRFQLQLRRNTSATDLTYVVQIASKLGTWNTLMTYTAAAGWVVNTPGASAIESSSAGLAPDRYVVVTVTDPTDLGAPGATGHFLRLLVHR